MVGFVPVVKARFENGEPWSFCSGAVLFSFGEVRPREGFSPLEYASTSNGFYVVIDSKPEWPAIVLKLVQPG
jgi:hypothetical protein